MAILIVCLLLTLVILTTKQENRIMTVADDINAKVDRLVTAVAGIGGDVRELQRQISDLLANQTEGLTRDQAIALNNKLGEIATAAENVDVLTPPATPPVEPPVEPPTEEATGGTPPDEPGSSPSHGHAQRRKH